MLQSFHSELICIHALQIKKAEEERLKKWNEDFEKQQEKLRQEAQEELRVSEYSEIFFISTRHERYLVLTNPIKSCLCFAQYLFFMVCSVLNHHTGADEWLSRNKCSIVFMLLIGVFSSELEDAGITKPGILD